jgi:hypothetical protein
MHRLRKIGLFALGSDGQSWSDKAVRQIDLAASGNFSNSFSAALIHEMGRVFLVIGGLRLSGTFFSDTRDVVIYDNRCRGYDGAGSTTGGLGAVGTHPLR